MLFKLTLLMSNFAIRVTKLSLSRTTSFTRRATISSLLTFVLLWPPDDSLLVGEGLARMLLFCGEGLVWLDMLLLVCIMNNNE